MIESLFVTAAIEVVKTGTTVALEQAITQLVSRSRDKQEAAERLVKFSQSLAELRSAEENAAFRGLLTETFRVILACLYVKAGIYGNLFDAFVAAGGKLDAQGRLQSPVPCDALAIDLTLQRCIECLELGKRITSV